MLQKLWKRLNLFHNCLNIIVNNMISYNPCFKFDLSSHYGLSLYTDIDETWKRRYIPISHHQECAWHASCKYFWGNKQCKWTVTTFRKLHYCPDITSIQGIRLKSMGMGISHPGLIFFLRICQLNSFIPAVVSWESWSWEIWSWESWMELHFH